ncbi:MAG: ABC transporter substrate-binding protein [Ilumatobacter sp.]|uniref:heme/hemin ABC transporter substrate-binding protein n=1 Tax=Ilumatobacter sp. TaxID=1967498 RepID=UPI00329A7AE6
MAPLPRGLSRVVVSVAVCTSVATAGCRSASTDPLGQEGPTVSAPPIVSDSTPSTDPSPVVATTEPVGSALTGESVPAETAQSEVRIVPVDGDLAEIVFALGFGEQVVATDISATYPASADELPVVGYQRALSPEPILAFEPTIVLATDLAGPAETLDDLDRLGVEVVVIERQSTALGPGDKIRAVADALGVPEKGDELADRVDAEIATETERAANAVGSPRVGALYVRGESVQLLLGEGGGVDWLIEAAGGIDIADELGVVDHAPINSESLLVAAPEVLIVPERGLESVGGLDGLLELPGIAETPAGRSGRILVYDDQFLLGNGPRTGALLHQLITDLHGDI